MDKWNWMMDYCYSNRWAPANSYYWQQAEIAFNKHVGEFIKNER